MKHFRLSRVVDLLALPDARSDGSPRSPSPRSPSPCSASSFYSSSLYSSSIDSLSSRSASRSASRSPSRSSLSPSTLLNAFAPVSAEERRTLWALVESTLAPTTATLDVRAAGAGSQDDWIRRFGNVRLEDVGGDGDCQFRVLAALIYDDADKLGLVREQIATHMRRHPAQFATAHWNSQSRRVGDNAHSRFANLDEFCDAIGRDGGEWTLPRECPLATYVAGLSRLRVDKATSLDRMSVELISLLPPEVPPRPTSTARSSPTRPCG